MNHCNGHEINQNYTSVTISNKKLSVNILGIYLSLFDRLYRRIVFRANPTFDVTKTTVNEIKS